MQFSSVCYDDHSYYCPNNRVYGASYGLRTAGFIISICLALPWPLLLLWLTNGCTKETLRKLTDLLHGKQAQVKKMICSLLPSLRNQISPSSFEITVPTSADPGCYLQQTVVITIMLLANIMLSAQLLDAGMTPSNLRTSNILKRLEDPEEMYSFDQGWLPLGLPWLEPAQTKLTGIVVAPVTFFLCIPLLLLNQRLSFASLVISLFLTIPLVFFYAFLSVSATTWLILLVPSSLPLTSLAFRIVIAIAPSIIAALFFALELSFLENYAKQNTLMEEKEKKTTSNWTLATLSLVTLMLTVGGLIIISTNLMQRLPSFVPDCSNTNICQLSSYASFNQPVTAFVTFGIAHLGLSMTLMVIAFLVFLVGQNISGLTSWVLGSNAFGLTITAIVYYALFLRKFMEPMEFDILNTEFIFINNAAVGLLVGSVFMFKGCKAFVEVVACLLNVLLVLPLLVSFVILVMARGMVSLATLSSIKVDFSFLLMVYFH